MKGGAAPIRGLSRCLAGVLLLWASGCLTTPAGPGTGADSDAASPGIDASSCRIVLEDPFSDTQGTWNHREENDRSTSRVDGGFLRLTAVGLTGLPPAYADAHSRDAHPIAGTELLVELTVRASGSGEFRILWSNEDDEQLQLAAYGGRLIALRTDAQGAEEALCSECPDLESSALTLALRQEGDQVRFGVAAGEQPIDWFATGSTLPGASRVLAFVHAASTGDAIDVAIDRVRWLDCAGE